MKCNFKVSDNLTFEVEGDTTKDVFQQLASVQEIFGHESPGDGDSVYSVRTVDENDYYEIVDSKNRRIKMQFGQTKKGNQLFPRRIDDDKMDGQVRRGWYWVEWVGHGQNQGQNQGGGNSDDSSGSTKF